MLTVSPEPQFGNTPHDWTRGNLLDEPDVRSLHTFLCTLASSRELHDALRLISEEVRAYLGARFVAVMVYDDERQEIAPGVVEVATINVPLRLAGRTIGQITAYMDRPRQLTGNESRMMELVAAVAAVTLDNANHLQRERKRLVQAEAINSFAPRIASAKNRDDLAHFLVGALRDKLHYEAVRLLFNERESGEIACVAATRCSGTGVRSEQAWHDGGVALRVLEQEGAILISDREDWRKNGVDQPSAGLRSLLAVPLKGSRRVIGVLEVGARSPRAFDNADLGTLSSLAALVVASSERLAPVRREHKHCAPEADHGRSELLSLVVHDLRGPLSLVKGYASTLMRLGETMDKDKHNRFLVGIDEAADRLAGMVDHLAGVSRLDSGLFQPKLRQVDLTQLVTETVERLRPKLGEHPITMELPGEVLPVEVDYDHLGGALASIVLSAAHRSAADARITVRIISHGLAQKSLHPVASQDRCANTAVVEIRDQAPEIPRDQLARVFDRFYRFPVAGQQKSGGLELYVAKKIVEAHKGRVWADSEPGQGSALSVALPLSVGGSACS